MFSTSGGHEYIEGCSVHLGDTMSTSGMFSTLGGYHDACGEYHEYIRRCSVRQGFQYKSKAFIKLLPHMNHDIPQGTHGIPLMY